MDLVYKNKQSIKDILKKAQSISDSVMPVSTDNKFGIYIHGDNFDGMARLLRSYKAKVDLVYIDPPFNTKGTFFYNKKCSSTISYTKEDIIAYQDDMSFEEYIEFIRERLILIYELLSPQGTLYFHIDTKVGHYIKIILDEIFGEKNFVNDITRLKSNPKNFKRKAFGNQKDVIYVYAKKFGKNIFNDISMRLTDGQITRLFNKLDNSGRLYTTVPCHAPGETKNGATCQPWRGMLPPKGRHWRVSPSVLDDMDNAGLIEWSKTGNPRIIRYFDTAKGQKIQDVWTDFKDPQYPSYPTEKNIDMLEMIVKQSSNEGAIIMDCFCGSGNFLSAGLKNNRFVIGIDKSIASKDCVKSKKNLNLLDFIDL